VLEEMNGDNQKTLLLVTVKFSYRWKVTRKDFFVTSSRPPVSTAFEERKI